VTPLFSLALFASAALLFLLEPMVGKFVLPKLGSTPEVWTTTVLFFQVVLLAGYAYAHLTSRLPPRRQALIQLALLATAALVLPIGVPGGRPPTGGTPIPWLLGTLAMTAGPPFFVLAANGPMLQRWLAATKHKAARDPYFLFAASNGGSLVGLLLYPLVVERLLTLEKQGELWALSYGLTALLVIGTAASAGGRRSHSEPAPSQELDRRDEAETGPAATASRAKWLALAAVPSSYMLGVTTYLTRDLSPVPLLWVIPLAIYLLTLVVAFAPGVNVDRLVFWGRRLLPGIAILVAYTIAIGAQRPLWLLVGLHLAGLAVVGLLCHARLAADRPPPARLTEYYLFVALGGALGGAFNAIVAPAAFPGLVEYPLALVAACLLRPAPPHTRPDLLEFFFRDPRPTRVMDYVAPVLLGLAVAIALLLAQEDDGGIPLGARSAVVGLSVGLAVNLARRPVRFGFALGAILLAAQIGTTAGEDVLLRDRSFFGIYRVIETNDGRLHELYDGNTLHGAERIEPGRPEPLTYYNRAGPVGQALRVLHRPNMRVGGVGLGAGALACYARPGDRFTFYEIDPAVARIARDPDLFTYLRDCGDPPVVIGDGRLALERTRERYDLLVIDAFNSDAIPVHLLTREAVELYLRLVNNGVVLFNTSNRYADLEPVLGNVARDLGVECIIEHHVPTAAQRDRGYSESEWVAMTWTEENFADFGPHFPKFGPQWKACRDDPSLDVWTDDYSNLLSVVDWS
jgi:hypothetical protein